MCDKILYDYYIILKNGRELEISMINFVTVFRAFSRDLILYMVLYLYVLIYLLCLSHTTFKTFPVPLQQRLNVRDIFIFS